MHRFSISFSNTLFFCDMGFEVPEYFVPVKSRLAAGDSVRAFDFPSQIQCQSCHSAMLDLSLCHCALLSGKA